MSNWRSNRWEIGRVDYPDEDDVKTKILAKEIPRRHRMLIERWGTLSVKDHLDAQALVADLLLYDRLVFPVISGARERTRWRGEN